MIDRKYYHYKYFLDGDDPEGAVPFTSDWEPTHVQFVAEDAAADYNNNGAWNRYNHPIRFTILTADGTLLGTYSVLREYEPTFWATEVK